jgi:hypothetical protein
MKAISDLAIEAADPSDVDAMALAHRDSIRSIGPMFYPPNVVDAWEDGISGAMYLEAMETGEVFSSQGARWTARHSCSALPAATPSTTPPMDYPFM